MCRTGVPSMLVGMSEAARTRRNVLVAAAGVALFVGTVAVIVVWDPIGSLVRAVDLPEWVTLPDLPDVPRWLLWALGKVKFVVIAVVVLVVAIRELRRGRGA
jgi:hypothetical protein